MNTRLAVFAVAASVGYAFIGHANMYNDWAQKGAVNLNGPTAQNGATQQQNANPVTVPQIGSTANTGQQPNDGEQHILTWTDGERSGYLDDKGNAFDGRANQIGINVAPGEKVRAAGQGRIGSTQGGNNVIYNPGGDAIGVVRPSGAAHWFRDGKNEVVPKLGNLDSSEMGNDPAVRQPQTPSNVEQLQERQQPFTHQQEDGMLTDKRGCVYDNKTARKVGYEADSECEKEWKRKDDETCKAHEPMDKRVVNKIAHDNLQYFNSDVQVEMQMHVMRDGRYTSAAWGDKHTVGGSNDVKVSITDDIKAVMVIHSHPFDNNNPFNNEYSRWPSFMDIVAHLERGMKIKYQLKSISCSYGGENYSYIAYFTEYSGQDVVKSEKPMLVRFDETGVYKISENGTETWTGSMPKEWRDRPFDGDHRPFDFGDDKEWARAKGRAEKWFRDNYVSAGMKSGRVAQSHKEPDSSSTDMKKTLEEFHARFLSLPNSQFKWQEIQAYLDLVVSMQTLEFPQDKVSKWKVSANNLSWKDLVDPAQSFANDNDCWAKEKIGVRGWCKCQPLHVTKRDSCSIGVSTGPTQDNGGAFCGLLNFRVCEKCGKCYTYRKMGDDSYNVTFTVWPYKETAEEHIRQTHKFRASMAKMEDAILSIPEDEIVVPIKKKCHCKFESAKQTKEWTVAVDDRKTNGTGAKFYVCKICCGLYDEDKTCRPGSK